ncbi:MAG: energy-coupling factor transporter ATPase [Bacilli bacterium]
MTYAIETKDLCFSYEPGKITVDHLNVKIKQGSYTVILGRNGSGKSTFAKLVLGLLSPESGSIHVEGIELSPETVYEIRNKVGTVFQNPDNQFIGATVRDDIAFGLENHMVPREKMDGIIEEYAEKVGMVKALDKEPSHLSGGQKQRVAIAGVLAMSPNIVIFDEATSMLDPKGKRDVKEMMNHLRKTFPSLTVISITHDVDVARFADEIIVFNKGKIYAQGTPEEIFSRESELVAIHLDVPFCHKLRSILDKRGISLSDCDEEEMVKVLCR